MIHRQFNAPKLLAKVGAVAHIGRCEMFELRDITDPRHKGCYLVGFDGWLAIVGGVTATSNQPAVTWKLIDAERVRAFYVWLAEWMNQPEQPQSATRKGAFRSEQEYQEHLRFERSWEEISDDF